MKEVFYVSPPSSWIFLRGQFNFNLSFSFFFLFFFWCNRGDMANIIATPVCLVVCRSTCGVCILFPCVNVENVTYFSYTINRSLYFWVFQSCCCLMFINRYTVYGQSWDMPGWTEAKLNVWSVIKVLITILYMWPLLRVICKNKIHQSLKSRLKY